MTRNQPLVIPALAIAGASLEVRGEEADDLLCGLELLGNAVIAPLRGTGQAARLADVIARTGLDPWNAHVAAIADVTICPILTLNAATWRQPSADLDEPLHVIEISDPEEPALKSNVIVQADALHALSRHGDRGYRSAQQASTIGERAELRQLFHSGHGQQRAGARATDVLE